MKTEIAQAAADYAMQKAVAGSAAVASGAATLGFGDALAAALGAPFVMLLAAFFGASLVLSFLPRRPVLRVAGSVAMCTMIGAYGAPWASKAWPILAGGDKFLAIAIGAGLQILLPIVVDQGGDVLRGIRHRLGIGDGSDRSQGRPGGEP